MSLYWLAILAQNQSQQKPQSPATIMLFGIVLMVVVFYFVLSRGNKKQQRERQQLLDSLTKNTKVMTVGGVVGTIVSVRDKYVVLKVDEATNTKMTFLKSAIQGLLGDADTSSGETA